MKFAPIALDDDAVDEGAQDIAIIEVKLLALSSGLGTDRANFPTRILGADEIKVVVKLK